MGSGASVHNNIRGYLPILSIPPWGGVSYPPYPLLQNLYPSSLYMTCTRRKTAVSFLYLAPAESIITIPGIKYLPEEQHFIWWYKYHSCRIFTYPIPYLYLPPSPLPTFSHPHPMWKQLCQSKFHVKIYLQLVSFKNGSLRPS